MDRISPRFRKLLHRLDRAIDELDNHGLGVFCEQLQTIYADFPADPTSLECVLTGHAHIDLVWLWPERVGDFKAVHTLATATRLMELYPELRFGYSQPASYAAIARQQRQGSLAA